LDTNRVYISGEYIAVKKPSELTGGKGKRRRFALSQKVGKAFKLLTSEELESINENYVSGVITAKQALDKVEELVQQLYKERDQHKPQVVHMPANIRVLNKYWDMVYSDRELVDRETMFNDIKRAVGSVGKLSLISATKTQLQQTVNEFYKQSPNLQRRAVTRLNQLLKFLNRGFQLSKVRERMEEIQHLSMREWMKVSDRIEDKGFKILCWVAMTTGCRLGEIFAISDTNVNWKKNYINVSTQIDKDFKRRTTKNRRSRKAFLLDEGQEWLKLWLDISDSEKERLRTIHHADKLKEACEKVFSNQNKFIKFDDLRHSYAVHLLSKEVPLSFVAQSLGNSHKVCEKYYVGFVLADESIETISRILNK